MIMMGKQYYYAFWLALGFLTRIPTIDLLPVYNETIDSKTDDKKISDNKSSGNLLNSSYRDIARLSLLFYPLVGFIVGLVLFTSAWVLTNLLSMPAELSAVLIVFLWFKITGGLHLDGVADTADAWVGGMAIDDQGKADHEASKIKTLAIMKDSFIGPMGVIAIVFVLLLKTAGVLWLIEQQLPELLMAVALFGRGILLPWFKWLPYVRENGLGFGLSADFNLVQWGSVIATSILVAMCLYSNVVFWSLLVVALAGVFWYFRAQCMERIGGTTGDTAGMMIEYTEVATLVFGVALISII